MLTEQDKKYWSPLNEVKDYIASLIPDGARVLEIGPGSIPFAKATHFVDWHTRENSVACDMNFQRLPFADNEFDFIYCRHVLEDLYNPFHACDEMSRVGKAGYIETPSPATESCIGVDGSSPNWRGYIHHRYFVWPQEGALHFMAKYPVADYLDFGRAGDLSYDEYIANVLRQNPIFWNSYFLWQDEIRWQHWQHEVDFNLLSNYHEAILAAVQNGILSADQFSKQLH